MRIDGAVSLALRLPMTEVAEALVISIRVSTTPAMPDRRLRFVHEDCGKLVALPAVPKYQLR